MNRYNLYSYNVKIRLTSINSYSQDTNAFKLEVVCPGMTQKSLQTPFYFNVGTVWNSTLAQIVQDTDFIDYTSCSPSAITLLDANTNSAHTVNTTQMTWDSSTGKVKINTNYVQQNFFKIRYQYDGATYFTNSFEVKVQCIPLWVNNSILDYSYFIRSSIQPINNVLQRKDYVSDPSLYTECPISYHLYDESSGFEMTTNHSNVKVDSSFGSLTVDQNTPFNVNVRFKIWYTG